MALSLINELIEESGTNFDLILKGDILFAKDQFIEAKNAYKGALMNMIEQAEALDAQALVNERLGDSFAKLKKTEEALRYWKEAARIGPGSDLLEKKILNEEYME